MVKVAALETISVMNELIMDKRYIARKRSSFAIPTRLSLMTRDRPDD